MAEHTYKVPIRRPWRDRMAIHVGVVMVEVFSLVMLIIGRPWFALLAFAGALYSAVTIFHRRREWGRF